MAYRRRGLPATSHGHRPTARLFGTERTHRGPFDIAQLWSAPPARLRESGGDAGDSALAQPSAVEATEGRPVLQTNTVGNGPQPGGGQMYAAPWRLLRALSLSAACVSLSVAAHILGAGPGAPIVSDVYVVGLLSTLLLTLILATFSARRWTLGRSLVALGLGQAGVHAMFSVLQSVQNSDGPVGMAGMAGMAGGAASAGGASMVLAHGAASLLIGVGIAVNDSALDTYFQVASSLVASGIALLSKWCLAPVLIPILDEVARVTSLGHSKWFARWRHPRTLTDLVVLQCLSRRGPPAFALAS
jgi:hypothetical protein